MARPVTVLVLLRFEREKMETRGEGREGASASDEGERKTRLKWRKDDGLRDMRELRLVLVRMVAGVSVT